MNKPAKTLLLLLVLVITGAVGLQLLGTGSVPGTNRVRTLETSDLYTEIQGTVERGTNIQKAIWQGNILTGTLKSGDKFTAYVPEAYTDASRDLMQAMKDAGVKFDAPRPPVTSNILNMVSVMFFPLLLLGLLYFLIIRPAQIGGNQALSFGRSKARRVGETGTKVTFEDVAGIDEAKQELYEIVDFLRNTKKYASLGAKIPKGILLTGPPGVGKTHLARAIAGEAGVPFFHISGSDFVEMFVGVGAARVRDLFETAKAHRPSLIFIDEIDAVGRQRGAGLGGGHDEREQTLNQMLVEMDGFDPNSGVILIAATNRPDVLDPALLRPGRFDRQIVVDVPDANGREEILKIHSKGKPFENDIDMGVLARRTPGFTGADLANMLNESALLAARRDHHKIAQKDLEEALDRVVAGPQRNSRIIDSREKEIIAYHEAGHALIGEVLENTDPVHKVTILPRGMSLGSTWSVPEQDKFLVSEQELLDDITMTLGGRVAEEVVFGEIWTGASSDLDRVTKIARAMVCEYGMSKVLGTLALGRRSHNPFLGRDYSDERNYSEEVARMIDEEIRLIVDRCHSRATELLNTHREQMDAVVLALLERETLTRDEFLAVLKGEKLPPISVTPSKPTVEVKTEKNEKEKGKNPLPPRLEPGTA